MDVVSVVSISAGASITIFGLIAIVAEFTFKQGDQSVLALSLGLGTGLLSAGILKATGISTGILKAIGAIL